jgi:hypothetical protein
MNDVKVARNESDGFGIAASRSDFARIRRFARSVVVIQRGPRRAIKST